MCWCCLHNPVLGLNDQISCSKPCGYDMQILYSDSESPWKMGLETGWTIQNGKGCVFLFWTWYPSGIWSYWNTHWEFWISLFRFRISLKNGSRCKLNGLIWNGSPNPLLDTKYWFGCSRGYRPDIKFLFLYSQSPWKMGLNTSWMKWIGGGHTIPFWCASPIWPY